MSHEENREWLSHMECAMSQSKNVKETWLKNEVNRNAECMTIVQNDSREHNCVHWNSSHEGIQE